VLSQLFEDGEHPTAYWSKANRGAQKKYPSTQGECYAVVQGMKHFRSYLLGNTFTVVTDHSALAFLMKTKGDTAQMFRWSLIIQEYMPFDIAWREGRKHGNSDMCFVKCRNYLTKYELPEHPMERRYILAICKNIFLEDNCLMYGGNA